MRTFRWLFVAMVICASAATGRADDSKVQPAVKRRIKLEGFNVDGTVQKPQAFYVLPRAPLDYTSPDRPISFLKKIKKSLHEDPF